MAFSRSHRQIRSRSARNSRDRHGIVGLSGWLFADLLLAVAVIFLVAQERPTGRSGAEDAIEINADAPRATLSFVTQLDTTNGELPVWNEQVQSSQSNEPLRIKVQFSEQVKGFAETIEDTQSDIQLLATTEAGADPLTGADTGWLIESVDEGNANSWEISLRPRVGFPSALMRVVISEGAVRDMQRQANPQSDALEFRVVTTPPTIIDTKKSSQVTVRIGNASCTPSDESSIDRLADGISSNRTFITDVSRDEDNRQDASRRPSRPTFTEWLTSSDGVGEEPRIGFVMIYGPGASGAVIAKNWSACVVQAFDTLGWLAVDDASSGNSLPVKLFKEDRLSGSELKLELYFFNELTGEDQP